MSLLDVKDALVLGGAAVAVGGFVALGRWFEASRPSQVLDEIRAALEQLRAHAATEDRRTEDLDARIRAAYQLLRRIARKLSVPVDADDTDDEDAGRET